MKKIFSFLAAMLFAFGMTAAEFTEPAGNYYLKHNWGGTGNWTWKQTAYDAESGLYILRDIYGGTGCNYNTSASDNGSQWVATPTLVGKPAPGDSAVFALNGDTKVITITRIGGDAPAPTTYFLKHNWAGAGNWTWKEMTREGETSIYNLRDIYGGTGCNYNSYAADGGSTWVASPTLVGNPATGDSAVFTFDAETSTITITRIGEPAPEPVITYFLAGSFNEWSTSAAPFEGNTITVELAAGSHEFKVVKVVNGGEGQWLGYDQILDTDCSQEGVSKNVTEGDPGYGNIVINMETAGSLTVTIGENGKACVSFTTTTTAIDLVGAKEASAVKVVREGHLYILREGVIYNLNGAVVR